MRAGAHSEGDGVRFAVFSSVADGVDVCVFEEGGRETRHPLELGDGGVWDGRVPGAGHGTRYGFRVHGPWDPGAGLRCNAAKLLLDPYGRAVRGGVEWHPAVNGADPADSAPFVPRSVVCAEPFEWNDDRPPRTALADSVIYEAHVKGLTYLHPDVPEPLRGTYAGIAHPAVIEHLQSLGITAVELLPVHQFVHDGALVARGLRNYWGYQPIGYFAPHNEYAASDDAVAEFKQMVRALHAAGLEVLLDVVYNHTAEGNQDGPTLCFRGLDNPAYYRLAEDRRYYVDDTGVGNTLDTHRPAALRLVMDSLRYWAQEMHVDGFRFDLAATLGRGASAFDPFGAFLDAVGQDPVLSEVKLIAEPWDWGGYDLGDFPAGWSEWNGRYRDTVRDFWRGTPGTLADFATRLTGSSDLFGHGRRPTASINLVTVHDGFTLNDLVSYDAKHNEANGEGNRDGNDDNRSWNCGAEGPTDDPSVLELRARQRRNFLATLLLSEGVPLLLGGDELGRTQRGNNNAYCQDNEISWVDWTQADRDLFEFVARVCRLRREHNVFRRTRFFAAGELRWLRPDGQRMEAADWSTPGARAVAVGGADSLLLVNAWWQPLSFRLPDDRTWAVELDTADPTVGRLASSTIELAGRSLVLAGARAST
ncbi:MAG: glycogen debranching protein GlgX [Actinomycetota bacterium]|nr:glycogen debranching protein GlgX [Actinomycetota bacterium]